MLRSGKTFVFSVKDVTTIAPRSIQLLSLHGAFRYNFSALVEFDSSGECIGGYGLYSMSSLITLSFECLVRKYSALRALCYPPFFDQSVGRKMA